MSRKQKERVRLTALNIFFIVLCFITLIPILYSISVSLNGQNTLLSSDFSFIPKNFSLENYRRVLFGEDILTWLGNSVYLAVVTVSLSLCVAIPAAYCFSRRRFPGSQTDFEVPCAAQFVSGCPVDVCRIPPAPPDGTYQSPNRPYPDLYRDHGGLQPLEYQGLF